MNLTAHTLLERNEARRVGGTETWLSVSCWDVRHGELGEVVTSHLWLDLDGVEHLAVVDGDDRADHFWHNDHV